MWAPIEGIDTLRIAEADAPEHALHTACLRAHLADHVLRVLAQQTGVDLAARKQIADEGLVLAGAQVGLRVAHVGETPAEGFPQAAGAVRLERRHQLREELRLEQL